MGPSSSHTMGPGRAAEIFAQRNPGAESFRVELYGSLGATGEGHMTLQAIRQPLQNVEIVEKPEVVLPFHPNGMLFEALDAGGAVLSSWQVFSIGGGALKTEGEPDPSPVYALHSMERIIAWALDSGNPLWKYVEECEGPEIWDFLRQVWLQMQQTLKNGLDAEGVLPGGLKLQRKSSQVYNQSRQLNNISRRTGIIAAYALATAEENAGGGIVVTAPTCGSCGVLPAVLRYLNEKNKHKEQQIVRALATAGLVGNLVKKNASISGAEVGCQGEIGTACAMAAAAAAQLLGGSPRQIEYAAEMGLEHHLGLTCDPVKGLVQIPCIERNAMAATRALNCAEYALLSDGEHMISFDQVVRTMKETGHDLPSLYRETATGGLASTFVEKKPR